MENLDLINKQRISTFPLKNKVKKNFFSGAGFLLCCLVVCLVTLGSLMVIELIQGFQKQPHDILHTGKSETEIQAEYNAVLKTIEAKRAELLQEYRDSGQASAKCAVLKQAGQTLFAAVYSQIIPYWYGTAWDFNGTTQTPGSGTIACGYFVTTVLRDASLAVERSTLAQQASENIVRSLVTEQNIRRFSNVGGEVFLEEVRRIGPGLYVLGLDKHVGFLIVESEAIFFIHASFLRPFGVVKEPAASSRALMSSGYRVLGNLLADDQLLLKWLGREKIPTVK